MHVMAFLTVKEAKGSAGTTGPATIRYDVHIAARNEEVACARFNEARGCTKVLNLSRMWGRGNKYRVSPGFRRTVQVCQQRNAIAHRHGNIVVADHRIGRRGQVAIVAARGLLTIQPAFPGLDSGRSNDSHDDALYSGHAIR